MRPAALARARWIWSRRSPWQPAANFCGEQPEERLRVWYHNGEDNLDEIRRRIGAICQHYRIPQEELRGWLWVTSGAEFPLRVAQGYTNLVINDVLVRQISAAIGDNQVDVAILDPLVTLHSVSEQDNNKMDAIVRIFFRHRRRARLRL